MRGRLSCGESLSLLTGAAALHGRHFFCPGTIPHFDSVHIRTIEFAISQKPKYTPARQAARHRDEHIRAGRAAGTVANRSRVLLHRIGDASGADGSGAGHVPAYFDALGV